MNEIEFLKQELEKERNLRKNLEISLKESENKSNFFKLILDEVNEAINVADEFGQLIFCNKKSAINLGYSQEELLNKKVFDVEAFYPTFESWNNHFQELKKEKLLSVITKNIKSNGSTFPVEVNAKYLEQNKKTYAIAILRDISEKYNKEKEIINLKNFLSNVLNGSPIGIMTFKSIRDLENKIIDFELLLANPISGKLLNIDIDKSIGKRLLLERIINKNNGYFDICSKVVETSKNVDFEFFYKDENVNSWFYNVIVKQDDGFTVFFSDITNRKNNEIELERKNTYLQSIFNAFPDIFFRLDKNGLILDYQAGSEADLYVPPSVFLGKNCRDVLPHYIGEIIYQKVKESIKLNISSSFEYELPIENGHFEARVLPIGKDEAISVVRNISDRKESEIKLQKSLKYLSDLQFAINQSAIVSVTDENGIIKSVNDTYCDISGYSKDELINNSHKIVNSKYHPKEFFQDLWEKIQSGNIWKGEVRNKKKNGKVFWVYQTIVPFFNQENEVYQYMSISFDISIRKDVEQELIIAKDEAETASAAKSNFLANMSHELRTPLNAIIGYSEMLIEEAQEEKNENMVSDLERIVVSGRHLLSLINDVLDLSKIEAGKMELFYENFNLSNLLNDVLTTIKPSIDKNQNILNIKCSHSDLEIYSDLKKIKQILINLLSNASKFTNKDEIILNINYEKFDKKALLTFEVIDHGIGISKEQMDKLFQSFSQADSSTTRKYGGSGLGLVITQKLAKMMGGDINVESEISNGSIFIVKIPISLNTPIIKEDEIKELVIIDEKKDNKSILIISDNLKLLNLIQDKMLKNGLNVIMAFDIIESINIAKKEKPIAITLDLMMDNTDAWEILKNLKSHPDTENIPLIIVSLLNDKVRTYTIEPHKIGKESISKVLNHYFKNNSKRNILIVDDDVDTRNILRKNLVKHGCFVMEADNGESALEKVEKNKPDLILLDLMMPKVDGFKFINLLEEKEYSNSIPIIILTSKDVTNEDKEKLNKFAIKILRKGEYNINELMKYIENTIKHLS